MFLLAEYSDWFGSLFDFSCGVTFGVKEIISEIFPKYC
jgi:hypothetical protein